MKNLTRTRNKLLKNGYIAIIQEVRYDEWADLLENGTNISFYHDGKNVNSDMSIRIHGRTPDLPQFDEYTSTYSASVNRAIILSRC